MQSVSPERLRGIAADIQIELKRLQRLADDIAFVRGEITRDPGHARLFYENLVLKLHNFYTGCERIFQTIATELNGAPPGGFDWHRRLLERMGMDWGDRPAVLSSTSIEGLREYLAFRHVVRHLYGFELDEERLERLVTRYPLVWRQVETDIQRFVAWLEALAEQLSSV
jgi:hypothetical protein